MHSLARVLTVASLCATLALAGCSRSPGPGDVAAAPAPADGGATTGGTRAVPTAVRATIGFTEAVANGTRTTTGVPGPRYWQQWADYDIDAELDPATARITGSSTVRYVNRSPDTLPDVYVHLYNNLFESVVDPNRDPSRAVPGSGGVTMTKVVAQGDSLGVVSMARAEIPTGYAVTGTVMRIRLPEPLTPGDTADFEFGWQVTVPPDGAPRGGHDAEVFYVAYWYPQMAVYDDVVGWQTDQYLGNAEFYMGYGNYDVALTVPAGWLVGATGALANPDEVLSAQTRARLDEARRTTTVVRVVTEPDRGAGKATAAGTGGKLTWRFRADSVRDFAWGTSDDYLWDATHAAVGDATGDGRPDTSMVHSFWRPSKRSSYWNETARYTRHSIEFLSRYLWAYPYPHMTAMDGPTSCGGMEYPMMTCIGGAWDSLGMYEVTVHEVAHMWFPMMVGSDEKRHSWMDEGLTQFNQSQAIEDFYAARIDDEAINRRGYLNYARTGGEVGLMVHGDRYPDYQSFGIASYYKPATILVALRGVLGEETFHRAFREYGRRWYLKHPKPDDLWNSFEDVSGRDLDWFWRTWFYETWTLDQAIAEVQPAGDSMAVVIENEGSAPMPVDLVTTYADGTTERTTVPVDVWLRGARRHTVRVPAKGGVTSIVIDPENDFPDVDRGNQSWTP